MDLTRCRRYSRIRDAFAPNLAVSHDPPYLGILLFVWGVISFRNLPIEAYPDVANNYVQIITQWPGRAAEEVEQHVTIPIEIVMNGLPHLEHLRSTSVFGLSSLMLVFDDDSENDWNRQKALERLSSVTLPENLQPQIGTDYSPVGQIFWYTLKSTNPEYDLMELKSLEDWVLEKQFKSVPNVVDVSSFGGITKEYQVQIDPEKLVSYNLNLSTIEQQLANNNINAGGSFIEAGLQQVNVRSIGLFDHVNDIGETVLKTQNGTPIRISDIAHVTQGPKIRLGRIGKAVHRADGTIVDDDDAIEGIVLLRKGADSDSTLDGIHAKVKELNEKILPRGVKVFPFLDRSDLVHYTTETVMHNLHEGIILVALILFLFLGNTRGADRRDYDSLRAAVRLNLSRPAPHSGEPALVGRARFRHGGGWRGGHDRKHRAPPQSRERPASHAGAYPRGGARSTTPGFLRHRDHHHGLSAHLYAAKRGRPPFQTHGLDGGVCAPWRIDGWRRSVCCLPPLRTPSGRIRSGPSRSLSWAD